MRPPLEFFRTLLRSSRGATAVEYGFILALVVLAVIAAISELATTTTGVWENVSTKVQATN